MTNPAADLIAQHGTDAHSRLRSRLDDAAVAMRRAVAAIERAEFPARMGHSAPGAQELRNLAGLIHEAAEHAEAAERLERAWLSVSILETRP